MRTRTGNQSDMAKLRRPVNKPTIMDKSLGTLLHFFGVFQFTQDQPLLSPHKQCWTSVSRIFFRVPTLYVSVQGEGGWEIELQGNFEKDALFYEGTQNEYCITVPRTFVHDCSTCANSVEISLRVNIHLLECPVVMDIAFMIDVSGSIPWQDIADVKEMMKKVTSRFLISSTGK